MSTVLQPLYFALPNTNSKLFLVPVLSKANLLPSTEDKAIKNIMLKPTFGLAIEIQRISRFYYLQFTMFRALNIKIVHIIQCGQAFIPR